MTQLALDAEALYGELRRGVQQLRTPDTQLVGITSGGAWLAERLHADLALAGTPGAISSSMHRDDFAQRGLAGAGQHTHLPFDVELPRGPARVRALVWPSNENTPGLGPGCFSQVAMAAEIG